MKKAHTQHFDKLIRLEEASRDNDPKTARPITLAGQRGVIAWSVSEHNCIEFTSNTCTYINLHDLPVPVAALAWSRDFITWDALMLVLAAHDQVLRPGYEGVYQSIEDCHFQAACWCGWESDISVCKHELEEELENYLADSHGP